VDGRTPYDYRKITYAVQSKAHILSHMSEMRSPSYACIITCPWCAHPPQPARVLVMQFAPDDSGVTLHLGLTKVMTVVTPTLAAPYEDRCGQLGQTASLPALRVSGEG
jgi:hypothetical protein